MVQSSHGMLTQHITGQGQIGFEFANAGSIDQGRQRVVSEKIKMSISKGIRLNTENLSNLMHALNII
jgi:hypothetical protein